jgi:hypothetical protein
MPRFDFHRQARRRFVLPLHGCDTSRFDIHYLHFTIGENKRNRFFDAYPSDLSRFLEEGDIMIRRLLTLLMVTVVIFAALPVSVGAQEGEELMRTGLRPDAPPYGVRGPYWVGTMEFVVPDSRHELPITIWYPALNPDDAEEAAVYDVDIGEGLPPVTVQGQALVGAGYSLSKLLIIQNKGKLT